MGVVVGVVCPQDFCVSPWHFDDCASSKIDDVLAEVGGLLHVLPLTVHLNFFWQTSRVDHSETFLLSEVFCGTPPSCLKVMGWVVGVGGWPTGF